MKSKLGFLFVLGIFLISLLSFMVLAAVPTPGDALKDLGGFFKDLLTGETKWENAYLLTFVMYFIIFMALFVEGLKWLPLFGGRGEISTTGKWFAFAAAMLATLGIFIGEQTSGLEGKNLVAYLLAPFGVWGGLALAAIVAFITYRGVKDSGVFGEGTLNAMAIAGAVGVTVAGWLLGMGNMLGWGFLILIIMMIVGAIKAWTGRERAGGGGGGGGGGKVPPPTPSGGGKVPPPVPSRLPKEEAAEEAFTLKEMESIKKAYEKLEKVRQRIDNLGKEKLTDKNVDEALVELELELEKPLKEAKGWGRKAARMARKVKRDFRRAKMRELKKEEEKAMGVCQEIVEEVKKELDSVGKIKDLLKNLKEKKLKDGTMSGTIIGNSLAAMAGLKGRLEKIYEHLGILFKLEEEIKKKEKAGKIEEE